MKAFTFLRPKTIQAAARTLGEKKGALLKAGGIVVLDRLKERVDEPSDIVGLVDVQGASRTIESDGLRVRVGALATLNDVATSALLPASLREAAAQAASLQIRNVATVGGNLAQHTRCGYYRLKSFPCLKRGDDQCPVRVDGAVQETAGIFDVDPCACAHPSSLAPAFGTLDAVALVVGPKGPRKVRFENLWAQPTKDKASDLSLAPDEVIASIDVRGPVEGWRVAHEEVRRRGAFDWPMVVAAAALRVEGGKVAEASVWLGSVAPTPKRSEAAEKALVGHACDEARATKAAEAAARGATPLAGNAFKVQLVKVAVNRALVKAWEAA